MIRLELQCPHCGKKRIWETSKYTLVQNLNARRAYCFYCKKTFVIYHYGKRTRTDNIVKVKEISYPYTYKLEVKND